MPDRTSSHMSGPTVRAPDLVATASQVGGHLAAPVELFCSVDGVSTPALIAALEARHHAVLC